MYIQYLNSTNVFQWQWMVSHIWCRLTTIEWKKTHTLKVNSILWWFAVHTNTNSDWPTFHPTNRTDTHTMMYFMNLRRVTTPRLCRLCRQHCQIISLICSIQIGKVYIQPQASYSNHIKIVQREIYGLTAILLFPAYSGTRSLSLSLFVTQNLDWFYWNFIAIQKHSAHTLSMYYERCK